MARAIELGINYFDTAPSYGDGQSEANLGKVLKELSDGRIRWHEVQGHRSRAGAHQRQRHRIRRGEPHPSAKESGLTSSRCTTTSRRWRRAVQSRPEETLGEVVDTLQEAA